MYVVVKIFSWALVSHENYSLKHFQQWNNSRRKFSRLQHAQSYDGIISTTLTVQHGTINGEGA